MSAEKLAVISRFGEFYFFLIPLNAANKRHNLLSREQFQTKMSFNHVLVNVLQKIKKTKKTNQK